ncbi:MAG: Tat pathway signal sequence [Coriobacteriaceae bacterium]|nr:Tat pathway signal sequence [Coriobacteriaceae bacterium]
MNHDEILEMLRRAGVEMPGGEEPIDVEVEVEDVPDGAAERTSAPQGAEAPKTARERKRAAQAERRARKGSGSANAGAPVPPFVQRLAQWSRRALVVAVVLLIVIGALCYWWFHPALNLQSPRVWSWIILAAIVAMLALKVAGLRSTKRAVLFNRLAWIPALVIVAFFAGVLMGAPFMPGNAARYATVLKTTEGDFTKDIQEVDYADVPVIDRASAQLLGSRAMGSIPEFVSQFEISEAYSQINYQGRPVRVSPLTYADLFKWLSNRAEGIPAYVLVDMVTQEAEVVRLTEPIRYSESEPLARNIDRYVQLRYPTYMFDQKSFELDEDGTPWWVFPVQKRTIGLFEGTTIQRVVLVNACTGETKDYAIEDCPTWVDRAYPSDLLIEQYNWSGAYKNGWLNSWLGQQGVVRTTQGTDGELGYNYLAQGDDIYLYTGVSSVTADSSNVGFILVNQRTGESHYYPVAGATEDSAMASAEGQVQNLRYQATYPLLLNVAGQPTYFMALKDSAGLVKMYAMINVEHYQSVATGSTVAATQESYLQMLASSGALSEEEAAASGAEVEVSGKIASMAQAVIDGNSHFYLTLEGDDAIYDVELPGLVGIVRYGVGDKIALSYAKGAEEDDDPADSGLRRVTALEGKRAKANRAEAKDAAGEEPAQEAAAS